MKASPSSLTCWLSSLAKEQVSPCLHALTFFYLHFMASDASTVWSQLLKPWSGAQRWTDGFYPHSEKILGWKRKESPPLHRQTIQETPRPRIAQRHEGTFLSFLTNSRHLKPHFPLPGGIEDPGKEVQGPESSYTAWPRDQASERASDRPTDRPTAPTHVQRQPV